MKKHAFWFWLYLLLITVNMNIIIPEVFADDNQTTLNSVVIDGIIGSDWTDDDYIVQNDPDSILTGAGLNQIYCTVNNTGINFALNSTHLSYDNPRMIFIDTDEGVSGISDHFTAVDNTSDEIYERNIIFTNDFAPNYFILCNGTTAVRLYKYTAMGVIEVFTGIIGVATNRTIEQDLWNVHYEIYIPWEILYEGFPPLPESAVISVVTAMFSSQNGDGYTDLLPNQYFDTPPGVCGAFGRIIVSDLEGNPHLVPITIDWPGASADGSYTTAAINEVEGGLLLGGNVEWRYELSLAINNTAFIFNDYLNTSLFPLLHYTYYNSSIGVNTSYSVQMWHQAADQNGIKDIFRYTFPLTIEDGYTVGDKFYWYITAGNLNETDVKKFVHEIYSPPPIFIEEITNVAPSSGFRRPNEFFDIKVDVRQLWNGSDGDPIQADVLSKAYVNYTLNNTDSWNQIAMKYNGIAPESRVQYQAIMPKFNNGSELLFYINVSNENMAIVGPYSIMIVFEPPFTEIFYMEDPHGDELGIYPTGDAYDGYEMGLTDIWEFNVSVHEFGTQFAFRINTTIDPGWGAGNFSHQCFLVAIDFKEGGSTSALRNVNIEMYPDYAWDYAFYFDGFLHSFYTPETLADPQSSFEIKVSYRCQNGEHWYSLYVPKEITGDVANESWNYYGIVGFCDFNHFRAHNELPSEWLLGGGSDSNYDPNYCDILVPIYEPNAKAIYLQELVSQSYNEESEELGTMMPVGNNLNIEPDSTAPLINIHDPVNNSIVPVFQGEASTSIELNYTVEDPLDNPYSGIKTVAVYIDEILFTTDHSADTEIILNMGDHLIRFTATDMLGNNKTVLLAIKVEGFLTPVWDPLPSDHEIWDNCSFGYDVNVTYEYRVESFNLTPSFLFSINEMGWISNHTQLIPGNYSLSIIVLFDSGFIMNATISIYITGIDSDGDGLSDYDEIHIHETNPNLIDTDGDGLSDYIELFDYHTDPLEADSDGDGITDQSEVEKFGTNPNLIDSDNDGFTDFAEITAGSDPLDENSDPTNVDQTTDETTTSTTDTTEETEGGGFFSFIPGYPFLPFISISICLILLIISYRMRDKEI